MIKVTKRRLWQNYRKRLFGQLSCDVEGFAEVVTQLCGNEYTIFGVKRVHKGAVKAVHLENPPFFVVFRFRITPLITTMLHLYSILLHSY